jgi:hypothetical protein
LRDPPSPLSFQSLSVLGVERCRRGRRIMARRAGTGAARGGAYPAFAYLDARHPCMRESYSPCNARVGEMASVSLRRVPIQMRAEGDGSRSVPARCGRIGVCASRWIGAGGTRGGCPRAGGVLTPERLRWGRAPQLMPRRRGGYVAARLPMGCEDRCSDETIYQRRGGPM